MLGAKRLQVNRSIYGLKQASKTFSIPIGSHKPISSQRIGRSPMSGVPI